MQHHLISLSMLGFLELKFKFRGAQPIAQYNWIYYRGVKMYCNRLSNIFPCRLKALLMHNFQNNYSFFLSWGMLGIPLINILGKLLWPSGSVYLLSVSSFGPWLYYTCSMIWVQHFCYRDEMYGKCGTQVVLRHFNLIWIWFVICYTTSCNIIYLYAFV